eukprot:scaffold7099_cov281-Pinguiococcus_pyrenoidosus.AAC.19
MVTRIQLALDQGTLRRGRVVRHDAMKQESCWVAQLESEQEAKRAARELHRGQMSVAPLMAGDRTAIQDPRYGQVGGATDHRGRTRTQERDVLTLALRRLSFCRCSEAEGRKLSWLVDSNGFPSRSQVKERRETRTTLPCVYCFLTRLAAQTSHMLHFLRGINCQHSDKLVVVDLSVSIDIELTDQRLCGRLRQPQRRIKALQPSPQVRRRDEAGAWRILTPSEDAQQFLRCGLHRRNGVVIDGIARHHFQEVLKVNLSSTLAFRTSHQIQGVEGRLELPYLGSKKRRRKGKKNTNRDQDRPLAWMASKDLRARVEHTCPLESLFAAAFLHAESCNRAFHCEFRKARVDAITKRKRFHSARSLDLAVLLELRTTEGAASEVLADDSASFSALGSLASFCGRFRRMESSFVSSAGTLLIPHGAACTGLPEERRSRALVRPEETIHVARVDEHHLRRHTPPHRAEHGSPAPTRALWTACPPH